MTAAATKNAVRKWAPALGTFAIGALSALGFMVATPSLRIAKAESYISSLDSLNLPARVASSETQIRALNARVDTLSAQQRMSAELLEGIARINCMDARERATLARLPCGTLLDGRR